MIREMILTGEHLTINAVQGRTDALIEVLQAHMIDLTRAGEDPASVKLHVKCDGIATDAEWNCDDEHPDLSALCERIGKAGEIDAFIQMCCSRTLLFDMQKKLTGPMAKGKLKDCARLVSLVETELVSSLAVCGMYRGTFIDDAVPFAAGDSDVLHITGWNNSTQRAVFTLRPGMEDEATDIADSLSEALDIDIAVRGNTVRIDSVHLDDFAQIELYAQKLRELSAISEVAELTGAMSPDRDDVFGLLRFVQDGDKVTIQTASAN